MSNTPHPLSLAALVAERFDEDESGCRKRIGRGSFVDADDVAQVHAALLELSKVWETRAEGWGPYLQSVVARQCAAELRAALNGEAQP